MKKLLLLACLALACMLGAGVAQAASAKAERFYIEPEVGLYGTSSRDVSTVFTYGASAGVFISDEFSLGGEVLGYYMSLNDRNAHSYNSANAFGINGLVRFYPYSVDQASFYVGTGIGGLFADERLDYNGYYKSWTVPVDLGVAIDVTDQFTIDLGGRYQRIGFTKHGFDTYGGNLGLNFMF